MALDARWMCDGYAHGCRTDIARSPSHRTRPVLGRGDGFLDEEGLLRGEREPRSAWCFRIALTQSCLLDGSGTDVTWTCEAISTSSFREYRRSESGWPPPSPPPTLVGCRVAEFGMWLGSCCWACVGAVRVRSTPTPPPAEVTVLSFPKVFQYSSLNTCGWGRSRS